ncbi:hypothetical protein E2C01_010389 [Portunus trituberculatus]|uniref:Uncharacterized protein n=1 Tax=Portunus trituberculatus TaxID=210409 RepID=A0A5B7D8A3_PORTR|nr:hypothetical protein [Portunus trituberculatus]
MRLPKTPMKNCSATTLDFSLESFSSELYYSTWGVMESPIFTSLPSKQQGNCQHVPQASVTPRLHKLKRLHRREARGGGRLADTEVPQLNSLVIGATHYDMVVEGKAGDSISVVPQSHQAAAGPVPVSKCQCLTCVALTGHPIQHTHTLARGKAPQSYGAVKGARDDGGLVKGKSGHPILMSNQRLLAPT